MNDNLWVAKGLLSSVSTSPSTGRTGPLQEPSPLASGPDFLIGLPFTRKLWVKGAIFKPIK